MGRSLLHPRRPCSPPPPPTTRRAIRWTRASRGRALGSSLPRADSRRGRHGHHDDSRASPSGSWEVASMALSAALPMSVHKSKSLMKPSRLPSTKNVGRMPAPRHWRRFSVSSTRARLSGHGRLPRRRLPPVAGGGAAPSHRRGSRGPQDSRLRHLCGQHTGGACRQHGACCRGEGELPRLHGQDRRRDRGGVVIRSLSPPSRPPRISAGAFVWEGLFSPKGRRSNRGFGCGGRFPGTGGGRWP